MLRNFNIDYKKTKSPEYKKLKDLGWKYQLSQCIKNSPLVTNRVCSTIKLIFSKIKDVAKSGVLCNKISDHLPIYLIEKRSKR